MLLKWEDYTGCNSLKVIMRILRGAGGGRRESERDLTMEGPGDATLCLESGERNPTQKIHMAFQHGRRQGIQSFSIKKSKPARTPL